MGKPLRAVYPVSTLGRILHTGKAEYNVSMKSLPNVRVLSDRLPIYENGQLAGAVGIFRNRTEVTQLADDLTGVQHLVDAMRAYTHEFMNKLHVILGLLQIGQPERAEQYIMDTTRIQREAVSRSCTRSRSRRWPLCWWARPAGPTNWASASPWIGKQSQCRKFLSSPGSLYHRAGQSH